MIPFKITFRNIPPSDALWDNVQAHIENLEKFFDHIISCTVVLSIPHRHHHKGRIPHVSVHLLVPGNSLIVDREPERDGGHEDIYVVISDAFHALSRKLEDYVERKRHFIKERHALPHGFVARLFPDEDYGFIQTSDGRELYFNRHSVLNEGFDRLIIGMEVRFSEEETIKGPQISSMSIVRSFVH